MARADFLTGLTLFALGVYMIFEGMRMPGAGGFIESGGEPGRVPIMLGAIIAVLALILIGRSVARGIAKPPARTQTATTHLTGWIRSGLTALGCSLYAVGLLGAEILGIEVPYREATVVFVFLFIAGFEWSEAPSLGRRRWAWLRGRWPSAADFLAQRLDFVSDRAAPYLWLLFVALLQAVIVAYAIAYLFEHELYVTLP